MKSTFIGMAITMLVCLVLFVSVLSYLGNDVADKVIKEEDKYKKHIGLKHVIDKDTLTIVDYSIWDETFTLSDGRKVNYMLIGDE